jgi:hypothetical protein
MDMPECIMKLKSNTWGEFLELEKKAIENKKGLWNVLDKS